MNNKDSLSLTEDMDMQHLIEPLVWFDLTTDWQSWMDERIKGTDGEILQYY